MTKRKTTRHRTIRSTAVSRAKRAAHRRAKVFGLWKKRLLIAAIVIFCLPIAARVCIHYSVRDRIYSEVYGVPHCHYALVLGAKVMPGGELSKSLACRVEKAAELWREGKVDKLLMSGDNRFANYNEPARMRDYAVRRGVPREFIVLDYAGRRTYDSVYRARYIFGLRKLIVVTQSFHVDRAVFLCDHLGVRAYGVQANASGDLRASIREIPACLGALADVYLLHPHPVMGKKEAI